MVTLIYFGPVDFSLMVNLFWSFLYVCPIHCDALFFFFYLGVMLVLAGTRQ